MSLLQLHEEIFKSQIIISIMICNEHLMPRMCFNIYELRLERASAWRERNGFPATTSES